MVLILQIQQGISIVMNGIVWALQGLLCGNSVKMQAEVIVVEDKVVLATVMLVREMRLRPMLRAVRLVQLEVLRL